MSESVFMTFWYSWQTAVRLESGKRPSSTRSFLAIPDFHKASPRVLKAQK